MYRREYVIATPLSDITDLGLYVLPRIIPHGPAAATGSKSGSADTC